MTFDRKLGPLSIVSNQTNVIYRAVDTLKVPQTRSPTNLRHFPDRIGIGTVAFTPRVKESRLRNLGNFYLWNAEYAQGIQNPSKNDWNPESKFYQKILESSTLESGIHGVESRIQDCPGFPYNGQCFWFRGENRNTSKKYLSAEQWTEPSTHSTLSNYIVYAGTRTQATLVGGVKS